MNLNPQILKAALYLLVLLGVIMLTQVILPGNTDRENTDRENTVPITGIIDRASRHEIAEINVRGHEVRAVTRVQGGTGATLRSRVDHQTDVVRLLNEQNVDTGPAGTQVTYQPTGAPIRLVHLAINFLPLILSGALILFILRQAARSTGNPMSFLRSSPHRPSAKSAQTTFADVAGIDEAKQELQEIVDFLRFPERFVSIGARIPRGVLMAGPPGTGKTLMARAVAGEANTPFFQMSGSEFVQMFVGVGAARVRDLFEQARRNSPCIIFIDEIDAIGRHRGAGLGYGNDEREQTLNQILVNMDGFETNEAVIVIAATNRPDILDPALLRPGRFDRRITIDLPDALGREQILRVHAAGKPLAPDVQLRTIARETPGFSGAELANTVNEAALMAARESHRTIAHEHFEEALERVTAGPERKSRKRIQQEREITAYHEAGHAVVAWALPHADPPHRVTITPRGNSGGHTTMLPEQEHCIWTRNQLQDTMAAMMGGRAAEEITFQELTTGAQNDIERATGIALQMVKQYGMSDALGHRTFGRPEQPIMVGRRLGEQSYGDATAQEIDREVREFTQQASRQAEQTIREHHPALSRLAQYLIAHESISGDALRNLLEQEFAGAGPA